MFREGRKACQTLDSIPCSAGLFATRRHPHIVGGLREIVMIVATTENIPGYRRAKTLGQVFGVVVRSRGLGGNIIASLRTIVGGEIHEYTQLLEQTRREAIDRMVRNATTMGAN